MKKLSLLLLAALAMISCGNSYDAKQVVMVDMQDSINYALGLVNGAQIKMMYLANDSSEEAVNEFIAALERGYNGTVEELSEAARVGKSIGSSIKQSEAIGLAGNDVWTLNEKLFFQGLVNGMHGDTMVMKVDFARDFFQTAYQASSADTVKAGKPIKAKCMKKVATVALKDKMDSSNYAFGLLNGNELLMYVLSSDTIGTAGQELIKYINVGLKEDMHNPQMVSMGEQIGKNIKDQEAVGLIGEESLITKFDLILQGFVNGMKDFTEQMTSEEANMYITNALNHIKYGDTKAIGEKFLEENKLKEGIIVTESGLQYEVLKMGKGKKPAATDKVKVHYHGTLIDGKVFDSSVERGEPIVFGLNQVIKGWTEGVQLMPLGSKFRFYIPQELGYGAQAAGDIPPYSTLIFEVELIDIIK
jgi:FKBP-type peptidyl-prolyl cis-trans isomerase FklB